MGVLAMLNKSPTGVDRGTARDLRLARHLDQRLAMDHGRVGRSAVSGAVPSGLQRWYSSSSVFGYSLADMNGSVTDVSSKGSGVGVGVGEGAGSGADL